MSFRVRVRVRGLVWGPWVPGPFGSPVPWAPLGPAQDPKNMSSQVLRNMSFRCQQREF